MNYRETLTMYRERANLNKTQLADRVGVSPSYIMNIEAGHKSTPTADLSAKIAAALNLSNEEREKFLNLGMKERLSGVALDMIEEREKALNSLTAEVIEALKDPKAVAILLETSKNKDEIKNTIQRFIKLVSRFFI